MGAEIGIFGAKFGAICAGIVAGVVVGAGRIFAGVGGFFAGASIFCAAICAKFYPKNRAKNYTPNPTQNRAKISKNPATFRAIFPAIFALILALNIGVCAAAAQSNSNLGDNLLNANNAGANFSSPAPNSNLVKNPSASANENFSSPAPNFAPNSNLAANAANFSKNHAATPATPATKNQTAWADDLAARFAAKKPPLTPAQIAFVAGEFELLPPQQGAHGGYELQAVVGERAKINGVWLGVGARLGAYTLHELRPAAATLRGNGGAIHLKLKSKSILDPDPAE